MSLDGLLEEVLEGPLLGVGSEEVDGPVAGRVEGDLGARTLLHRGAAPAPAVLHGLLNQGLHPGLGHHPGRQKEVAVKISSNLGRKVIVTILVQFLQARANKCPPCLNLQSHVCLTKWPICHDRTFRTQLSSFPYSTL